jgi:hypothetical protein
MGIEKFYESSLGPQHESLVMTGFNANSLEPCWEQKQRKALLDKWVKFPSNVVKFLFFLGFDWRCPSLGSFSRKYCFEIF